MTDGNPNTSNNDVNELSQGATSDIRVSQTPVDVPRGGFQPEKALMSLSGARKRVGGDPTAKEANRRKHSAAEQVQRVVSTALDQPTLMSSVDLRPGQSHSWVDTSDEFPDPLPPVSEDVSDVNDDFNRMAIPHPSDFQVTFPSTI